MLSIKQSATEKHFLINAMLEELQATVAGIIYQDPRFVKNKVPVNPYARQKSKYVKIRRR